MAVPHLLARLQASAQRDRRPAHPAPGTHPTAGPACGDRLQQGGLLACLRQVQRQGAVVVAAGAPSSPSAVRLVAQRTSCISCLSGLTRRARTAAPAIDVQTKSMK